MRITLQIKVHVWHHLHLVHTSVPISKSLEIQSANTSVDKGWCIVMDVSESLGRRARDDFSRQPKPKASETRQGSSAGATPNIPHTSQLRFVLSKHRDPVAIDFLHFIHLVYEDQTICTRTKLRDSVKVQWLSPTLTSWPSETKPRMRVKDTSKVAHLESRRLDRTEI